MVRFSLMAILTLILASCFHDKPKDSVEIPELELDRNETVLPSGVRDEWFAALDEAIEKNIVLYQGRVRMYDLIGAVSYVPVADVRPVCGSLIAGISLQPSAVVGGAESDPFGLALVGGLNFQGLVPDEKVGTVPAPELGVYQYSPAAFNLMDDLCRHLIDRLGEKLAQQ